MAKLKTIVLDADEFAFPEKFRGETVASIQEISGTIYVFTPTNVYIAKRISWLRRKWLQLTGKIA